MLYYIMLYYIRASSTCSWPGRPASSASSPTAYAYIYIYIYIGKKQ